MIDAPTAPGRTIRAPRGPSLSCQGWRQEAALRMLMNTVETNVAGSASRLDCGWSGKAVRDWEAFDRIIEHLHTLENDETLLVQSGESAGLFRTHNRAPRVVIHNTKLAAQGSYWKMCGQMAAAGWMSIGGQDALHGLYEVFAAAARKHLGDTLAGKLVVSGGMGSVGGAQALAATMNDGAFLGIDADPERIKQCTRGGYCDIMVNSLDEAVRILRSAVHEKRAVSVGLAGNCAEVLPEMARRGIVPDLLTDLTGAYDPLNGYIPRGYDTRRAEEFRKRDFREYTKAALDSIVTHVRAMLDLQKMGAITFDGGNNIRAAAFQHGLADAYNFPDFVEEYIRPLLGEGRSLLRWVALSGEPADMAAADDLALNLFPENDGLARWIRLARKRVKFQGLPARIGRLGFEEAARFGLAVNDLVARGKLMAPMAIGRDYLDGNCAASPSSEIESVKDSGAIANWAGLNTLLNAGAGASWISAYAGSGAVKIGQMAVAADGTADGAAGLERALSGDAGRGEA